VFEDVDWSHRAEYIATKHGVNVPAANSALRDPNRVVIDPDYNSRSGNSVRIIGYSDVVEDLLTVIAVAEQGVEYGVNCWRANAKDRHIYTTEGR
jgi:uncharacterized DUF497 family protein